MRNSITHFLDKVRKISIDLFPSIKTTFSCRYVNEYDLAGYNALRQAHKCHIRITTLHTISLDKVIG